MKKYLQALVQSFYSPDLYREVASGWPGIAGMYLLLALFISYLPGIYNVYGYSDMFASVFNANTDYKTMLQKMPNVTVALGALSIDKPSPYGVRDPETQEPLIVFDINKQLPSLDEFRHGVYITDHDFTVKNKLGEINTYELPPKANFNVGPDNLAKLYKLRWVWFFAVIFPAVIFGTWLVRVVFAMVLGVIALVFGLILKAELSYKQSIRITVVAMTPSILLSSILEALNFHHPVLMYAFVSLSVFYLLFAVIANRVK